MAGKFSWIYVAILIFASCLLLALLTEIPQSISECWCLSRTCKPHWEAWSSVGTVAAVFAAILIPYIDSRIRGRQRRQIEDQNRVLLWYAADRAQWLVIDMLTNPHRKSKTKPDPEGLSELASFSDATSEVADDVSALIPYLNEGLIVHATALAAILRGIAHDFDRASSSRTGILEWDDFYPRTEAALNVALTTTQRCWGNVNDAPPEWHRIRKQHASLKASIRQKALDDALREQG